MSLAVFVQPQLVRCLDPNSKPVDVWVVEFPFWLAKYLCDLKAQNSSSNDQLPFPVHQPPVFNSSGEEGAQVVDLENSNSNESSEEEQLLVGQPSEEQIFEWNPLNYDPHANPVMQPANIALNQQDLQGSMCVCADITPSHNYSQENNLPQHQNYFLSESQLSEQHYGPHQSSKEFYEPNNQFLSSENLLDAFMLPAASTQFQNVQVGPQQYYGNNYSTSLPDNFLMHISGNGSFFIENEQSRTSGFVSSNLQDWGFSHPLGEVLKTRRGTFCCFLLHSGTVCYVKFTQQGIKFSSNQSGMSYLIDEAGVRTCWESFKSFDEIQKAGSVWKMKTRPNSNQRSCYCGASMCIHQGLCGKVLWNSTSKDETIRIEREGLRFFSETRELQNLNLSLEDYYLSATLQNVRNRVGHIYVKSFQHRFKQSVFFNGKSLQIKFHTQSARLNSRGQLSLSD